MHDIYFGNWLPNWICWIYAIAIKPSPYVCACLAGEKQDSSRYANHGWTIAQGSQGKRIGTCTCGYYLVLRIISRVISSFTYYFNSYIKFYILFQ